MSRLHLSLLGPDRLKQVQRKQPKSTIRTTLAFTLRLLNEEHRQRDTCQDLNYNSSVSISCIIFSAFHAYSFHLSITKFALATIVPCISYYTVYFRSLFFVFVFCSRHLALMHGLLFCFLPQRKLICVLNKTNDQASGQAMKVTGSVKSNAYMCLTYQLWLSYFDDYKCYFIRCCS